MVDMKCEGWVKSVKKKLETVKGIKNIEADFSNQIVRILGSTPLKLLEALEQTGFKARLIGQGVPEGVNDMDYPEAPNHGSCSSEHGCPLGSAGNLGLREQ